MGDSIRDQIRAQTLGAKVSFKTTIFNYNGIDVEFRQPSLRDRKVLIEKSKNAAGEFDMIEFLVWAVISNTYVPETKDKVFEPSDYEVMMNQPAGSFVDKFGEQIAELLNVETDPKG